MATIEKRTSDDGSNSYRVKVRLKGHPIQSATFSRLTDAKRWATQTEAAIRERRYFKTLEAQKHTLSELIDRYTREVLPNKRTSTQHAQRLQLAWWESELGALSLADVTPPVIAAARDKLAREPAKQPKRKVRAVYRRRFKDGRQREPLPERAPRYRSPAYIVRHLAALSHVFTVAVKEWQWADENPVLKVTKPKEPRGRVRFLSDDERVRLLGACKASQSPWLYPVVVLALSTGMRAQEIMGLTWGRVDLKAGRILLEETKNGERRVVPLTGHVLQLLKEHSKVRQLDTDLLWPGRQDPEKPEKPRKPISLRRPWLQALQEAGIEDFRFHDLRHSAASYMLMNGATLGQLAEVLGHKTLQMVKRYSHLSESHSAEIIGRMNAAIFGAET